MFKNFIDRKKRYPRKSNDELKIKTIMAIEIGLCVSYWEDDTDIERVIKSINLLANEFLYELYSF